LCKNVAICVCALTDGPIGAIFGTWVITLSRGTSVEVVDLVDHAVASIRSDPVTVCASVLEVAIASSWDPDRLCASNVVVTSPCTIPNVAKTTELGKDVASHIGILADTPLRTIQGPGVVSFAGRTLIDSQDHSQVEHNRNGLEKAVCRHDDRAPNGLAKRNRYWSPVLTNNQIFNPQNTECLVRLDTRDKDEGSFLAQS